jgi:hypothetical protein
VDLALGDGGFVARGLGRKVQLVSGEGLLRLSLGVRQLGQREIRFGISRGRGLIETRLGLVELVLVLEAATQPDQRLGAGGA